MSIRDFDETEIVEINNYVTTQIPQTILPRLFIVTEEPQKKIKIFITIYRIIQAAKDFVEKETTKKKLDEVLNKAKKVYDELYALELFHEDRKISFGKHRILRQMLDIVEKPENNLIINTLTNEFLVFAEKQELIETDKVTGINMDLDEGRELYDKLTKPLKGGG